MPNSSSDFTTGHIGAQIRKIALPAATGYLFQAIFNITDAFWAGTISPSALAALSISFPIFFISLAFSVGLSNGTTVLVSNALGAKDDFKARLYYERAIGLSIIIGLALMVLVWICSKYLFIAMGVTGAELRDSLAYTKGITIGMPFLILFSTLEVGLSSRGNTRFIRNVLLFNAFINFGLDPLLLHGLSLKGSFFGALDGFTLLPALGIRGIGLSTSLVQTVGAIVIFLKVKKEKIFNARRWKELIPRASTSLEIGKYGFPTMFRMLALSCSFVIYNYYLLAYGSAEVIAGFSIGLRIQQLVLIPSIGLQVALSVLVGQNNGAQNIGRIKQAYKMTMQLSCILFVFMTLSFVFAKRITSFFSDNQLLVPVVREYMLTSLLGMFALLLMVQTSALLLGMKRPLPTIIMYAIRQIILPLIFIYICIYTFGMNYRGVFVAMVLSDWIGSLILYGIARINIASREREWAPQHTSV